MTKMPKKEFTVNSVQANTDAELLSAAEKNKSEQYTNVCEMEEIRKAAYARYEARQFGHGDPDQDWLEAEAEVAARRSQTASADESLKKAS